MLASKIVCPHCHKSLKTTKPLAVGKRVLCKQCGTTFRVALPDLSANTPYPQKTGIVTASAVGASAASSSFLDDEPITTELDGGRLLKLALVGLVLASGFLLIAGGSVLALLYAARKEKPHATLKQTETPLPDQATPPAVVEDEPRSQPIAEPVSVQVPRLSPEEQAKVDQAVQKGLAYLRKLQFKNTGAHATGMAALTALTMLECGVSPDDPQVQKAAYLVRSVAPKLTSTYEMSLSILFLDRLGNPKDENLIRTFALRLVAGQLSDGGWKYDCLVLQPKDEKELLFILEQTRPRNPLELFTGPDGKVQAEFVIAPKGTAELDRSLKSETQVDPSSPQMDMTKALETASPAIKRIPSLQPPDRASKFTRTANSDNSNTQFAILAVWVAGRHNVPLERTVAMIVKRFRTSQNKDGSWGYHSLATSAGHSAGSPAMTAAGLLGLGVGHGMMAGPQSTQPNQEGGLQDPAINKGFRALSANLDKPMGAVQGRKKGGRVGINLYFLWSVERVGVIYNLTKIADKDWYQWGAELLVDHQKPDGSWNGGGYPGSNAVVDTSLALLFLQRANVAKDLSKKLENVIDVKDLGSR